MVKPNENNMKRVDVAMFNRLSLLTRNLNRKISVNQNMAAHSGCLLMSGAVQRRSHCNERNIIQNVCLIITVHVISGYKACSH